MINNNNIYKNNIYKFISRYNKKKKKINYPYYDNINNYFNNKDVLFVI